MNDVQKSKGVNNKNSSLFFSVSFRVIFIINLISILLLYLTFTFDEVPPILNRGIQPATFPKGLLILIIFLSSIVYFLSLKNPWKVDKQLPKSFYTTLIGFIIFSLISNYLDFFLVELFGLRFIESQKKSPFNCNSFIAPSYIAQREGGGVWACGAIFCGNY